MKQTDILLITPPFTQLNTPYPATAFLKGFLKTQNFEAAQLDLGIETLLEMFSAKGLERLFLWVKQNRHKLNADARRMLNLEKEYISWIEPVVSFLQGKDNTIANIIVAGNLPQGARFANTPDMDWMFGNLGVHDQAKFLATLFIEDIGDFLTANVDDNFGFSRYAERLSLRAVRFAPLQESLKKESPVTQIMCNILDANIKKYQPKCIGLSVPFPGNLFAALKSAQYIRKFYPELPIILGGGYANTEFRELSEIRLFDLVDFVCLDDGERSLLHVLKYLNEDLPKEQLVRTYIREEGRVNFIYNKDFSDFDHEHIGTPDYDGLPLDKYISVLEVANPMHRLWSDGRWNKLAIAHGCYWHKCSFCDTSLDYIKRYSKTSAAILCDRIESVIKQTGQRGFHFVDEAAPPQVLRDLAIELLRRNMKITWWTNVRFEKTFSRDLCELLAKSGCIAVSGGLEVASNRLLELMQKGVSIEQVAQVCKNLEAAGIMVHAYLMYGFPTQTAQETIDSLEVVRQLFENGLVQSAFWHRFAMTVHSPVGIEPEKYGVKRIDLPNGGFARNDCDHEDPKGCDHEQFGFGLKKALYNYMHDMCFDFDMQDWFDFRVPRTHIPPRLIANAIQKNRQEIKPKARIIYIGNQPSIGKGKKGLMKLFFDTCDGTYFLEVDENEVKWLVQVLDKAQIDAPEIYRSDELMESYKLATGYEFKRFTSSKAFKSLRRNGLLFV